MSVVETSRSPIRVSSTEKQKDYGKQLSFIFSSVYLLHSVGESPWMIYWIVFVIHFH